MKSDELKNGLDRQYAERAELHKRIQIAATPAGWDGDYSDLPNCLDIKFLTKFVRMKGVD